MPYGQPDPDQEARAKAAKGRLGQYFGGQSGVESTPVAGNAKLAATGAPSVGAPVQAQQPKQVPATNVGAGAAQPQPQPQAQSFRPGPTNHTNFGRYQQANLAASQSEAQRYGGETAVAVAKANASREALRKRFSDQMMAGLADAPGGASSKPETAPVERPKWDPGNPGINPMSGLRWTEAEFNANEAAALENEAKIKGNPPAPGGGTPSAVSQMPAAPGKNASAGQIREYKEQMAAAIEEDRLRAEDLAMEEPEVGGVSVEEMRANAEKRYTGPNGLGDMGADSGYDSTYADSRAAQEGLGSLGDEAGLMSRGASKFGAALVSGAGRGQFDALRARFSPDKDLSSLEDAAAEQGRMAKAGGEDAAAQWGEAATKKEGEIKARADRIEGKKKARKDASEKAAQEADLEKRWQDAMKHNVGDDLNSAFNDMNLALSPITQLAEATGNRDPIQNWGTKTITPQGGAASGGANGQKIWWKPQHRDVFKQMDPIQWAELNNLPPHGQATWLNRRAEEIRRGKKNHDLDAEFGRNMFAT